MSDLHQEIHHCRICGSEQLQPVLDLGAQPPANSLRSDKSEVLPVVPLAIVRCDGCATIQLTHTVRADYLFKHYIWVTGTSSVARSHSEDFYHAMVERAGGGSLSVVEIASNDGTFLKPFQAAGHKVLGVDPAVNVAAMATEDGVPTWAEFFGAEVANKITTERGKADCVFARNVLPHVENVQDVVAGIALCLGEDGLGAIEFHHAQAILEELHYDSIYHEHLFFYSLQSLSHLLGLHGLHPYDVVPSPISGGSLVLYFRKQPTPPTRALEQALQREADTGLNTLAAWELFAKRSREHKDKLVEIVEESQNRGLRMIGYGASARSSTLLNFCRIDGRHLSCIADKSPLKHDKWTPGTDLAILAPEKAIAEHKPQSVLLAGWNFREEICGELREKHGFKGEVILPLPGDPSVITLD